MKSYLAARIPVARFEQEEKLFRRLPTELKSEVRRLQSAVLFVWNLTSTKVAGAARTKVQPACLRALAIYPEFRPLKTFRSKFDLWRSRQDWVVLVNKAKAGSDWQTGERGLPAAFLDYVAARMGDFKRNDAGEQAILSIKRQWITGRNHRGQREAIPGYVENWETRNVHLEPVGWSSTNIRKQLKAAGKFTRAVKALRHVGIAEARSFIPQVHSTRNGGQSGHPLRFLELVQFDDVRCDFRVMDTDSGQVNDMWLLIARDVATTMLLGFGMRPARARDDGTQSHLTLRDMKQLAGWLLETYGLPPYCCHWKMERGTATLAEGTKIALEEMLGGDRIKISYSSLISGKSPTFYSERALGNSKGKAMLESLNRLQHMMTSHFPGQIGLDYSRLPAEYRSREREAVEIWQSSRPEDRADKRYPFYTIPQAREGLFEIFKFQNERTDHNCEGFRRVSEWFDGQRWQPSHTAPADMANVRTQTRTESPIERAAWLLAPYANQFTRVSPEVIVTFYEHTQRRRPVENNGEIQFTHEGKLLRFAPPSSEFALAPGRKVLGYFNPDDPRFLTITDGRGGILGTWLRTALVNHNDHDALAAAIRHSTRALNAAKGRAIELAAGEQASLQAMRQHNAGFETVALPTASSTTSISSPVARTLRAVAGEKQETKKQQQRRDEDERIAREALEL